MKTLPKMYYKCVEDIDYDKLKKKNIKCILFDLDNTLAPNHENNVSDSKIKLIKKLSKNFKVYILSNNTHKKRLEEVSNKLGISYVSFALKPFKRGFSIIKKKENINYEEMCIIGDQIVTDIVGGNSLNILTILVDPLGEDLKITSMNRKIENIFIKKLSNKGLFEKGKYYE